jgi:two-component system, OmpR family, response regulator ResD
MGGIDVKKILIVDDEAKMRNLIRIYLQNAGYSVQEAADGLEALRAFEQSQPHVIVLDIMMPGMDGFETCAQIRDKAPEIPILMLTARTSVEDRVSGLSEGADDYLTKPFDGRELVARIQALVRRAYSGEEVRIVIEEIGLVIDVTGRTVSACNGNIPLTPKEFELILLLASRPGRTFPREEILERVWPYEFQGETRSVDSHIKNIREKLRTAGIKQSPIKTVWGVGYKFEVKS